MEKVIKPNKGSQELFLMSDDDICIFGGARGGGKSWALLLEVLRYIENPKFTAVIFRRTYPQIEAEGGLWSRSYELFPYTGAEANKSKMRWTFPSGATCSFRHLNNEEAKYNWQGAEICYLGFDELTHFTFSMFTFLMASNRSTCGIKPFIRATCNPDPDSWVKKLIKPWLNNNGYANIEKSGKSKMMKIENNNFEICEENEEGQKLKVSFIKSDIYDNPILLDNDKGYLEKLENLPLVERERFLGKKGIGGNWNIKNKAGNIFKEEWFKYYPDKTVAIRKCRFWDFGSRTINNLKKGDRTVGVLMEEYEGKLFLIKDVIAFKSTPEGTNKIIKETAMNDGLGVSIRWQREGGSAGVRDSYTIKSLLAGFDANEIIDNRNKIQRAKPLSIACENGMIYLNKTHWNDALINEFTSFPDGDHDDYVDAGSGAFNFLAINKNVVSKLR